MPDVTRTELPGVGVRYDFITAAGERLGIVAHRAGHREIALYDAHDPDSCRAIIHLDTDDARTLGEVLGVSQVSQEVASMQQIAGLAIDWLRVSGPPGGRAIKDWAMRTRTGVSVVAVIRGETTFPAPEPDFVLEPGDVAVSVGTSEGIRRAYDLLRQP